MAKNDEKQIGGTHYSAFPIQPTTFIHANRIGFIEGNVIKYVCRHRYKNGKQDIEKAIHYLQTLIHLEYEKENEFPVDVDHDRHRVDGDMVNL